MASTGLELVDVISAQLLRHRLPFGDELACQRTVQLLLEQLGLEVKPEYAVSGSRGRIDFFLPKESLGIELKVKGSPSDVARQLLRYAQADEIRALMVVTARARLVQDLPTTLNGKPLHRVSTWRGGL